MPDVSPNAIAQAINSLILFIGMVQRVGTMRHSLCMWYEAERAWERTLSV